ncbi:flagellar biosynthesis protein [Bordetella ansorpii]|uniref:Flagellar biosynthesis protein FlhF n=1 Tax=Bordetella ansorpii TaxID=288768 RepID=A0A157RS24_9BORD|nr:flagellar biosynthesis protein FlhF [Bordetella ansorpii]SAI60666.1 flagellar biosynthesis protein [Bordetella ansorpii]
MKLSRFVGATVREAMRQVREALGPDALIVSNRTVNGTVEVVATVDAAPDVQDETPSAGAPPAASASSAAQPSAVPARPSSAWQSPADATRAPSMPPSSESGYAPARALARYADAAAASPLPEADAEAPQALQAGPAAGRPTPAAAGQGPVSPGASSIRMPAPGSTSLLGTAAPGSPRIPTDLANAIGAAANSLAAARAPSVPASGYAAPMSTPAAYPPTPAARIAMPAAPGIPASAAPAALDSNPPVPADSLSGPSAPASPVPPLPSMAQRPDAPLPSAMPIAPASMEMGNQQMQAALDALRGALESRMDGLLWGGAQAAGLQPVKATLFRNLLEAGFSMPLVRALVERLPASLDRQGAMAWARNELVTHLPVMRNENDFLADGGVYALVGPTGVGKTTTLAKLAARCVAREGRDQVAMLTTDLFRIGALEQLQIYGRLMGVPAHSVRDGEELKQALAHLGHRKIILIDTTGISQRDRNVAALAALLHAADRPVRRLLVLNAASQGDTLDEVAHAYRNGAGEDVVGCIVTKLDEATRIAPALDTAIRHRLPIHYVSIGQKVPEDMATADRQALVDRALAPLPRQTAPLYAPSEADLAALWRSSAKAETEQKQVDGASESARRRQLLAAAVLPHAGADAPLDQAIAWLDSDPACVQARANWRAARDDSATPQTLSEAGLKRAQDAYAGGSERYLLAMHGKAAMKGQGGSPAGTLLAGLLMTDRGAALSAPMAHLMLPHGILDAHDLSAPMPENAVQALVARVRALQAALQGVPQVHLFEMGTAAMWQSLSAESAQWVARGAGALRVVQEDTPTTLAAVSRDLGYLPVGTTPMPGQQPDEAPLDLWASGTEVRMSARGHEDLPLRMVCARLTDPASGKVVNQLYGLTNLKASQADARTVARWLLQQEQAKTAFRHMAQAWAALPPATGIQAMPRQALLAAQLGVACWQLSQASQAESARAMLQAMAAGGRKLTGPLMPAALMKGFAMLDMAA